MWKLTYDAPNGMRVKKGFCSVSTSAGYYFSDNIKKWGLYDDVISGGILCSHHFGGSPKSVKAFLRYLKRHTELKGVEVTLLYPKFYEVESEIVTLNVSANWEENE